MKRIVLLMSAISLTVIVRSQNGTVGSPFTALGQAQNVVSNGTYFFNIGGNTFSTRVEVGGWVLAASGSGTSVASLTTTTALTLASDGILPTVIYTSNLVTGVRFNTTSGPTLPFDVNTTHATVLGNLQANRTLSVGMEQIGFAMWAGSGTSHMDIFGTPSDNSTLNLILWHGNGNFDGLHWRLPGDELVSYQDGSPGGFFNPLNLWIKAAFVALPVELISFNATVSNNKIKLDWSTASEINNDYFTIEKSINGSSNWQILGKVNGAGNSSVQLDYQFTDNNPVVGRQFYRLKQTDIDRSYKYSDVRSVNYSRDSKQYITAYPMPFIDKFTIKVEGRTVSVTTVKIYDVMGKKVFEDKFTTNIIPIDGSKFGKGIYIAEVDMDGVTERIKMVKE